MLFYRKARNSCLSHACVLKICFPPSKCSFQEVMPMSCPQPKSPSKCSGNLCFIFISSPLQNVWHDLRAMPPAKRCGQQWIKHRPQGLFSAHRFEVRGNKKNSAIGLMSSLRDFPKFAQMYATHPEVVSKSCSSSLNESTALSQLGVPNRLALFHWSLPFLLLVPLLRQALL